MLFVIEAAPRATSVLEAEGTPDRVVIIEVQIDPKIRILHAEAFCLGDRSGRTGNSRENALVERRHHWDL